MAPRVYTTDFTDLPDELIDAHVLPHLPTKSIGRFRCVSKSWRSLLSSSEFVKSHLKMYTINPNQPEDILLTTNIIGGGVHLINFSSGSNSNDGVSRRVRHRFDSKSTKIYLGPSCHGLVLLILKNGSAKNCTCLLMNPIIKHIMVLPKGPYIYGVGLGYDSVTDDYKILSVSNNYVDFYVYSVKMKTRRKLSVSDFGYEFHHYSDGVFLNGYIYWTLLDEKKHYVLVAFDLAREEFEQLPLPSGLDGKWHFRILVLEGFLALEFRSYLCILHILVMKEHGVQDSWINVANIHCPESYCLNVPVRVACLLDWEEIVLCSDRLFAYNRRNEDWRYLDIADVPFKFVDVDALSTFRGSLVSPILIRGD